MTAAETPAVPWSIVGHRWAVQQLRHAIAADEVPHALLITGPESVGKTTVARQLVAAILCRSDGERPCGYCLSCRKLESGNHPDFMEVDAEDRTSHLKIDQIRDVERFLALTPNESTRKIALIADFERATTGAANALLKTLEEPPSYAHLILVATDADLLLPTIVSRAQQISLRPLSSQDIADALTAKWNVDAETAGRLARVSGGRVGWAVRAITQPETLDRLHTAVDTLVSVLQQELPARFATAHTLAQDDEVLAETLETWLTFWRDVLLIQTNNAVALVHVEQRNYLLSIAERISVAQTVDILAAIEQSQEALLANANTQLLVENLLLSLPDLPPRG